jgi:hypothetical protein
LTTSRLIGLGALATMVGGGMLVLVALLHRAFRLVLSVRAGDMVLDVGLHVLLVVPLFLVPIGMVGFHTLQMANYGRIGRVGFWTVVVGSIAMGLGLAGYLWWDDPKLLWVASPAGTLGLVVGLIFYGAATLRARVLPHWCGLAFIAALPTAIALVWIRPFLGLGSGTSTTSVLFGLVWLALGCVLWTRRRELGGRPTRVK